MAIFGFGKKPDKPDDEKTDDAKGGKPDQAALVYSPEKAAKFYEHARVKHETGAYDYAMQMWLRGLKFDPADMKATQAFFQSAASFLQEAKSKKEFDKAHLSEFKAKSELDKYLLAIFEWSMEPTEAVPAVAATEQAGKLGLTEPARWIGERALALALRDKKPRKDWFIKLKDALSRVGVYDKAAIAADAAYKLDPNDSELGTEARNLAAKMAMTSGGFDKTGEAGGFRSNIRDQDKQRKLEEAERVGKTEETLDRVIVDTEADLARRPDDPAVIAVLAKRLVERGTPADQERAYSLLMAAYAKLKQFNFRQSAGEIRIRQQKRRALDAKQNAEANPLDDEAKAIYRKETETLIELEIAELRLRFEAYPTDIGIKYELGRRYFARGQYDDCIGFFQESQNDPKYRAPSQNMLGQSFLKIDYVDEAIETFRRAMEHRDLPNELQMELKYNLMVALVKKAEAGRDLLAAEEADKIASSIAVVQFNYRDIRGRRDALKKLIADLKVKP